jgi:hypothetical protein
MFANFPCPQAMLLGNGRGFEMIQRNRVPMIQQSPVSKSAAWPCCSHHCLNTSIPFQTLPLTCKYGSPVQGGNDYEIFMSDRTIGHKTTGPDDTISQCKALFMS